MKTILHKAIMMFLLVLTIPQVFAEDIRLSGIWQEENYTNTFYSFHQNEEAIIFIDLGRLEFSGQTSSATYLGSTEDYVLRPLATIPDTILSGLPIKLEIKSATEVVLVPICAICTVKISYLKKVF